MKEKWTDLGWAHRIVILLQAFLILLFLILYCTVGKQQVITYRDEYLRCRVEGAITTYSGKIDGQTAVFTVTRDTVTYHLGHVIYGPYTIVSDPTAVISEEDSPLTLTSTKELVGVEVWEGDTRLFRGSYRASGSTFYLVDTEGELIFGDEMVWTVTNDAYGTTGTYKLTDEPGPYSILRLVRDPDVFQRGPLGIWFLVSLICVVNAISVLYADRLFRWNLRFSIRNAEQAEPSEWELFSRWIGWSMLSIIALALYIVGLNSH